MTNLTDISDEIVDERCKQNEIFGEQDYKPLKWVAILSEGIGEVAKDVLESNSNYRAELIQVAAVAVAAIECYDRGSKNVLDS